MLKPVIQSPLVQMFFHTDRATVHTIKKNNQVKRQSPDCWVLVPPAGSYSANTVISAQPREMQLSTNLGTDAESKISIPLHQVVTISARLVSASFLTLRAYILLEK